MDRSEKSNWEIPEKYHYKTWIAERTNARMTSIETDEPFLVWASFFDPHPPYLILKMYDPEKLTLPQVSPVNMRKTYHIF